MKQKLLKTMLLLCALIVGGASSVWGQGNYATDYTGNITLSTAGGTNASTCTVVIGSSSYSGIKAGTSSAAGTVAVSVPAGTKYLHLHLASWNGDNTTVSVSSGTPSSISLTSDSGISGSGSSYTINSSNASTSYYKVITFSTPLASATSVSITSPKKKRFVIWGARSEAICATPTFSPASGEVTKNTEITISSDTDGATIYYTTDGTTPTTSSTAYDPASKPTIDDDKTIKAIAVKSGMANSIVGTATYTIAKAANSISFEGDITSKDIALTGVGAVSSFDIGAITSATYGTPTYTVKEATNLTEDTDFSLNASTGVLTFSNTYKGIIVVTASVAATETYKGATKDLTINCSGDLRTPQFSFDATETVGIDNTITVAAGSNVETDGDITIDSDDTGIATVNNETGVITGVAAGSCTITVTTAAGTYYSASSTSFTLNVVDYAILPFIWEGGTSSELTALTGVTAVGLGSDYAAGNAPYRVKMDTEGDYIQIKTNAKPGKVYVGVKMLGGDTTSKIKVQESADGSSFTDVEEFTISGNQNDILNLATTEFFKDDSRYVRIIKSLHASGGNIGVGPIKITPCESVTVSANEYATYASANALDFTKSKISAYIAVANGTTGVTFTQVYKVPANTGVLLYKEKGTTELIPVFDSSKETPSTTTGNVFQVGTGAAVKSVDGDLHNYILNNVGGVLGFYQAANQIVATNRAYIQIDEGTPVKGFIALPGFGDETAVEAVKAETEDGVIFNLAGQRVSKLQRGINIINGKKVVVK